ncbi:M48 family metallopeptidase [Undibacterium squillarum]|uniref:YgjP-like metallopeptidase domain-containing protein n=1 Tax=Undibacterium squillarum TaxID=1131567 RepID=A0ABQ2Y1S3_9BURK|nr:SprT family zinc-dependent metalloprotease [Undibacterium squillarum]GGX46633.1 hypothetical protein GCM10010946_26530 [Undibacterium squillarum]
MPVSQVFDRALQLALQLDLFSDLVTAPRTPVREPLATQPPPQQPLPPVAPTATTPRTTEPETPPPSLRTRQLRCGDQLIAYTLTRSSRRSIGLAIRDAQLHITAPRRVTIAAVEEAIIAKQRWILNKITEQKNRPARQRETQQWNDGALLPFMGTSLQLRFVPECKRVALTDARWLDLPASAQLDEAKSRLLIEGWLRKQALQVFEQKIRAAASRLGVSISSLHLSSARTRWGSCTSKGEIRLNWRLIFLPESMIDYVVAHELAHRREMNHSPRFWAQVELIYPAYREVRKQLQQYPISSLPL